MTSDDLRVRLAATADEGSVSRVLADAFDAYPWTTWTVEAADHSARLAALQAMAFTELVLPFGEAWVATQGDEIVSVALWMRPGQVPTSVWRALEARQARLEGDRHEASVRAEAFLAPHRPSAPHYFLGSVGTRPSAQRRGFGQAVLAPVLGRLDDEGIGAYLETCGNDNVRFYLGLGFSVSAEVTIPDGGPTVWTMTKRL